MEEFDAPWELQDLLICEFCYYPFNDNDAVPKLLKCSHCFCLRCVNFMRTFNREAILCIFCFGCTYFHRDSLSEELKTKASILYLLQQYKMVQVDENLSEQFRQMNSHNYMIAAAANTTTTTSAATGGTPINGSDNAMLMEPPPPALPSLVGSGNGNGYETNIAAIGHHQHHNGVMNLIGGSEQHYQQQRKQRSSSIASSSGGSIYSNSGCNNNNNNNNCNNYNNSNHINGNNSYAINCSSNIINNNNNSSSNHNNVNINGQHFNGLNGGIIGANSNSATSSLVAMNNNNNNNNNHSNNNIASNHNNNTNNNNINGSANSTKNGIELMKMHENCMTHAMPNTLWCDSCNLLLCRACAATEEHRLHPVKNYNEAKETLHNDITNEMQTMHKALNDVQHLMLKQRDFLLKILDSCTTLKTQIEAELINHTPAAEIAEIRESLVKARLNLDLLEQQTPAEALRLFGALHSDRQRLMGKYQEIFLQCKLDDMIRNSNYVFDFNLIKQALIQLHNSVVVNGNTSNISSEALLTSLSNIAVNNLNGASTSQQGQQPQPLNGSAANDPILFLANYCISQLYSRHMLTFKQNQPHQQLQHQQNMQNHNQQQQQQQQHALQNYAQHTYHQQHATPPLSHVQSSTPSSSSSSSAGSLHDYHGMMPQTGNLMPMSSMYTNNGHNQTIVNNANYQGNNGSFAQATYAEALQQSLVHQQQQQQHQQTAQQTYGGARPKTPGSSKSYADIICNPNNSKSLAHLQQQSQYMHGNAGNVSMGRSSITPPHELAPIGTPSAKGTQNHVNHSAISSSSPSNSSSNSSSVLLPRNTPQYFSMSSNSDFGDLGLGFLHLQHVTQSPTAQLQQKQQQQQQQQHQQHHNQQQQQQQQHLQQQQQQTTAKILLSPSLRNFPIYFFNIEINGKPAGRFLIEARTDVAPRMSKNFGALATHETGFGYKGCHVFQCWENESIITGDFEMNSGRGGRSVYDEVFFMPDETKIMAVRGAVGMRRSQKRHDNLGLVGSQFRIILREMRGFTGIFAFVVEGLELIEKISQTGDATGKPQSNVVIVNCGKYQISG